MHGMEDSENQHPAGSHKFEETPVVPVPPTGLLKVMGLLQVLDDHGGKEDIYKLARELRDSFGELLIIIKAAEVLGFVVTPGGDLVMQPLGKQIIALPSSQRKKVIGQQVAKLPLFVHFTNFLTARPDKSATRQEIMDELSRLMPTERPKPQFDALMNWGRYAEIYSFSRDDDRLVLVSESTKT
jgi:NitT/TauT family transport system ATP-binding protein